jgi:6-phosphogluconate dehydrogenase
MPITAAIFAAFAPGRGSIARTPGLRALVARRGARDPHCGANGGGHFVKMVDNGIEYGLMAAYAQGLSVLRAANVANSSARSMPRRHRCATPSIEQPDN